MIWVCPGPINIIELSVMAVVVVGRGGWYRYSETWRSVKCEAKPDFPEGWRRGIQIPKNLPCGEGYGYFLAEQILEAYMYIGRERLNCNQTYCSAATVLARCSRFNASFSLTS